MSIKSFIFIICVLTPISSLCNISVYTYITPFSIINPKDFNSNELDEINRNIIIISAERFSSTFIKLTKTNCNSSYFVMDVKNEDEAIVHRKYNNRNNIPFARADNYMQGYIRKTTNNYEISAVVKSFDNTFITFRVYENLRFSDNIDGDAINACLDNLAKQIINILCPTCTGSIKELDVLKSEKNDMLKTIKTLSNYESLPTRKQVALEVKMYTLLNDSNNYRNILVTKKTIEGLWWLNVKSNKNNAQNCFHKALNIYCSGLSNIDYEIMKKNLTFEEDIKTWLMKLINQCN